jgi:hypothetical protein
VITGSECTARIARRVRGYFKARRYNSLGRRMSSPKIGLGMGGSASRGSVAAHRDAPSVQSGSQWRESFSGFAVQSAHRSLVRSIT